MKNWVERVRKCSWGQLLFLASTSGLISGLAFAVSGVYGCGAIEMHLTHGNVTELGSAVLAIYAFLGFGATGFIAAFSSIYAIARRSYTTQPRRRKMPFDACKRFIGTIPLEDDELCQLVPDRNREGCRALYRMHAQVPQSDSGTFRYISSKAGYSSRIEILTAHSDRETVTRFRWVVIRISAILATEFCNSWLSMTTSMTEL